jgi:diguanylate cyclase (GGDEF)-like protein
MHGDQLVGVLNVSASPSHRFSEYDLRAVSLFAENASAAITKAQLYESSRQQAEELAYRATHDPLTDLANRRMLAERTERVLERVAAGECDAALLFVDLDGFKDVNDELGHLAGDELLVAASRRITNALRECDLAARVGGDEFGVLVAEAADERTALTVADRIVEALGKPFVIGNRSLTVSASVGLALAPRDGLDFDDLLRCADRALYAAKRSGKARWACSPDAEAALPGQRHNETAVDAEAVR